jgi:hypothetical protein
MPKNAEKFYCQPCDFKCAKHSNLLVHYSTRKHKILTNPNKKMPEQDTQNPHACVCNKIYRHRSSLCTHQKTCKDFIARPESIDTPDIQLDNTEQDPHDETSEYSTETNQLTTLDDTQQSSNISEHLALITELLKQNQELQKQILEISKEGRSFISNTTNNNNSKHFNLNVFLNEKCKDAINLMDFVESMQVQLDEFEATGRLGYVEGISKIIINRLKTMEVQKRPIHCTDFKRETMYIKDQDIWEKEDNDKPKLSRAVKLIADKNLKQLNEWQRVYPDSVVNNTKDNEYFVNMMLSILGGRTPEEDKKNNDKILRNIAREVVIDKDV